MYTSSDLKSYTELSANCHHGKNKTEKEINNNNNDNFDNTRTWEHVFENMYFNLNLQIDESGFSSLRRINLILCITGSEPRLAYTWIKCTSGTYLLTFQNIG